MASEWLSYSRKQKPQFFVSSYNEVLTKVLTNPSWETWKRKQNQYNCKHLKRKGERLNSCTSRECQCRLKFGEKYMIFEGKNRWKSAKNNENFHRNTNLLSCCLFCRESVREWDHDECCRRKGSDLAETSATKAAYRAKFRSCSASRWLDWRPRQM